MWQGLHFSANTPQQFDIHVPKNHNDLTHTSHQIQN